MEKYIIDLMANHCPQYQFIHQCVLILIVWTGIYEIGFRHEYEGIMISDKLLESLLKFRSERNWEQFHTARNLCAAICVESAELLDHFRWARDSEIGTIIEQRESEIENELADVAILLLYLCHDLGISMEDIISKKLKMNYEKYPIAKAKGTATKYDRLV
jgi:NTP pyrophosphatase (non-canonical NTP hydrolase)